MGEVRQRRGLVGLVESVDAFSKVVDDVKEEKRASSGLLSCVVFGVMLLICGVELREHFAGRRRFEYRFDVDTAYQEQPQLELDLIVATPCGGLGVVDSGEQGGGMFAPLQETIKKDPTRFEFTDEEQMYWTVLRHAHSQMNQQGLRGLEQLQYIDDDVEDNLEHLADEKQKEEAAALKQQRKEKGQNEQEGNVVFMIGNGMGMFQIVASNGGDAEEGTACRLHGKFPVRKGKEGKIIISLGSMGFAGLFGGHGEGGNVSHRIERFYFGRRVHGLVAPLAGAEQISLTGKDLYRYFIKVVPTKIFHGFFGGYTMSYQYAVTFLKKEAVEGEHAHGGILFEYEFAATVIEIREQVTSFFTLLIRLCAVAGGVFATSNVLHNLAVFICSCCSGETKTSSVAASSYPEDKTSLIDPSVMVH